MGVHWDVAAQEAACFNDNEQDISGIISQLARTTTVILLEQYPSSDEYKHEKHHS